MSFLGGLLKVGGSLLGGLFGSKKQKVSNEIDYVKMAQNAEKAGFNPLSALRAGGGAGFTTTTSHPGLSAWAPAFAGAANAAADFADEYATKNDPLMIRRNKAETALMELQLEQANKDGRVVGFGGSPQRVIGQRVDAQRGGKIGASAGPLGNGITGDAIPEKWENGDITVTNPYRSGKVDPTVPDVAPKQERYGESEIFEFIDGVTGRFNDLWYNVTGKTRDERYKMGVGKVLHKVEQSRQRAHNTARNLKPSFELQTGW